MKKLIAVSLCIITMIICGFLIVKKLDSLDIASNKTDWYVMDSIRKIEERTDIDDCEKKILKKEIQTKRQNEKDKSGIAFETQIYAFGIIMIQIILLFFIIMMPSENYKKLN
ncbi:hypothetical protein [Epilithonimonas arachidiradicis]|nr:hypothetical protein [Epilithonimonas arachidiradicis]RKE88299.1 hypothetical protein BXY58_1445 [Epilithonimonas arachidiradicis]